MNATERQYALDRAMRIGEKDFEADVDWLCDQLNLPRTGPHRPFIESFREQTWTVAVESALDDCEAEPEPELVKE